MRMNAVTMWGKFATCQEPAHVPSTRLETQPRQVRNLPHATDYHIPSLPELFSMIVVMEQGATPEQIKHMIERVEAFGLKAHPIQGTERTVIAAIGEKRSEMK